MTTTRSYDCLNRLHSVSSGSSALSFSNVYNSADQRIRTTLTDGSYWLYECDSLGRVKSGKKGCSEQTPVAGQQFEYAHDDIGNRTSTKAGGDASGAGLRVAAYSANSLNQYTARDVPGAVDIMGVGLATNAVTVNGATAYRKGEYFRQQVSLSNGSTPVWEGITVTESGQAPVSGNLFVPQTPEQFTYDLDGNLLSDGRWSYTWDAENRLLGLQALSTVPSGAKLNLDFVYDWRGRRIQKTVSTWNGSAYVEQAPTRFVYDGWNLLAILNPQSSIVDSFMWGLDLSGSMQGAGGVGGLLLVTYYGTPTTNCFVAYDGNGNVAVLVNAADGDALAQYQYGPFGEVIRATGPMAKANPLRFSTKYQDDETDLLYYGYRYYDPSTGRWLTRDPVEEEGGPALLAHVHNNPVNDWDYLGLCDPTEGDPGARQCGPDVTAPLLATINNIKGTFRSWSFRKKLTACSALYSPWARGAWGVDKIAQLGFPTTTTGRGIWLFNPPAVQGSPPPCDKTVAYKGNCYFAGDVDYLMWGAINGLCWRSVAHRVSVVWSLGWAEAAAMAWKGGHHDPWRRWVGAVAFTKAGWRDRSLNPGFMERWLIRQGSCPIRPGNRAVEPMFRWQWWPYSTPWGTPRPWPL